MRVTRRALHVCLILPAALGLLVLSPKAAVAKPCTCKDIKAVSAELARVTTAEAAWMEIFAWARGLHNDVPEPASNEELDTRYRQLGRAPRSEWDAIMHTPITQVEKVDKVGEIGVFGEPVVSQSFSNTHCDDIVEGVRVHELAHRDFNLSPGNLLVGMTMRSRHMQLRAESEVLSYRKQKAFLKEKLEELEKHCKFKVSTKSQWFIPNGPPFTASMAGAEIVVDAEGHFGGSSAVNWVGTLIGSTSCGSTMNFAPTRADLTGDMDDDGQLAVTVTYTTATASVHSYCATVSRNSENMVTPSPLKFTVPSSGGASTQQHELTGAGSLLGSVEIGVVPEEDP